MAQTLVGLYDTHTDAERIVQELAAHRIARQNVLFASHQMSGGNSHAAYVGEWVSADDDRDVIERLAALGVPRDEASSYAEGVRRGGALVVVQASDELADRGLEIMNRMQPVDMDERIALWQQEAGRGVNANTAPYTSSEIRTDPNPNTGPFAAARKHAYATEEYVAAAVAAKCPNAVAAPATVLVEFSTYDAEYRKHHGTAFLDRGTYVDYEPAYRYGFDLGSDARYRGRSWMDLEAEFRRDWELRQPGTWEKFKDAIRYGWERVRVQT